MNAYELADKLIYLESLLVELCNSHPKLKGLLSLGESEFTKAANMLRQQADLIRNLQKTLGFLRSGYESINLTPQTKPLSDEEIDKIIYSVDWAYNPVLLARAIEERHGIK